MVFIDHEPPCLISPPFRPDDDVFGEDDDAFGPDEDALDEVHDTFGGNCNIFGGLHSAVGEADDAFGELWDFFGQDDDPDLPKKLCIPQNHKQWICIASFWRQHSPNFDLELGCWKSSQ